MAKSEIRGDLEDVVRRLMEAYEESRDASVERCKRLIGHTRYAKNYILVDTESGLQAIPRGVLQQCVDNVHMQTIHRG